MINFTRKKTSRKKHSATFKAQVAIEAIKEQETLSELSKRFWVHPQMISTWKREFLSRSPEIFSTKAPDEEAEKREQTLYEKIGKLEVEVDFCKTFGILIGPKRVRRLLRKMGVMAIYPLLRQDWQLCKLKTKLTMV